MGGGCEGISAPFWTRSSAIGNGMILTEVAVLGLGGRVEELDPGDAGSAAARARKTACVLRERSVTFTLARSAIP